MGKIFFKLFVCVMIIVSSCTTQQKLVQTDLYFGLSQSDGNIITDSAWNTFVQEYVSKVFASGFTVVTSEGKWVDEKDKKLYAEPSHIIISINKMNSHLSNSIDSLRKTYNTIFQQQAVLRVDKKTKADF